MTFSRFAALAAAAFTPAITFAGEAAVRPIAPQPILQALGAPSPGAGFAGYLSSLHGAAVAAVAAIAVVMIVRGAVEVFGESVWGKTQGKARIQNAVFGLLLAAGSVVILQTVSRSLISADFNLSGSLGADDTRGVARDPGALRDPNRPSRYNYSPMVGTPGAQGTKQSGAWSDVNTESELSAWQKQYMKSTDYANLVTSGGVRNADGTYTLQSRVTGYWDGDRNTNAGLGAFGPLRTYSSGSVGTAAVDPSVIPYGSIITVKRGGTTQRYVAEDIGGAVVNRQASGQTVPVIDIATPKPWDGGYQSVTVQPYTQAVPYTSLSKSDKDSYLQRHAVN